MEVFASALVRRFLRACATILASGCGGLSGNIRRIFRADAAYEDGHKKVLQTLSVALLVILLMLTYEYSVRGWIANAALAAIPGLLTAFPFFILRKTQLPHESVQQVWSRLRNHPGFYVGLACVVVGLFALYALIQYGLYLLGTLKTQ